MNKKLLIGIGVIVVIAIIIVLTASPATSEAQKILRQALGNQNDLNSVSYLGNMSVDVSDIESGEAMLSGKIVLRGDATNLQEPQDAKMQFNLNMDFTDLAETGQETGINTSFIIDGQTFYLRLDSISLDAESLPFDLSPILKQWIRIDDIEEQAAALGSPTALGINPVTAALTEEQMDEIGQIAQNSDIFQVTEDLGMEDGHYHFAYRFDMSKLMDLMRDISAVMGEDISENDLALMEGQLDQLPKGFSPEGEIWIDEATMQIDRLSMNMEIQDEEASIVMDMNMDMEMLNLNNEDLEVEVPVDAITFEQALGLVMAGMFDFSSIPVPIQ